MDMGPILNCYAVMDIWNIANASRRGHVDRQVRAPTSLSKLCSQTCRYIIKRLTGDICAGCLQNEPPALLENIPPRTRLRSYYQHDITQHRNEQFPNRLIGRGGPQNRPPRLPVLSLPSDWKHPDSFDYGKSNLKKNCCVINSVLQNRKFAKALYLLCQPRVHTPCIPCGSEIRWSRWLILRTTTADP